MLKGGWDHRHPARSLQASGRPWVAAICIRVGQGHAVVLENVAAGERQLDSAARFRLRIFPLGPRGSSVSSRMTRGYL
ncbi:hypothetical protein FFF93_007505 [Arthrobacter sp. KBS0702]|nr:hypothetical protein FFF93_007505 [Arthrobacter sp. KBS0702]